MSNSINSVRNVPAYAEILEHQCKNSPERSMVVKLIHALKENNKSTAEIVKIAQLKPFKIKPLSFIIQSKAKQGLRPCMEDAHFCKETKDWLLAGIFDGHGDKGKISKFCANQFESCFFAQLQETKGDVKQAFQNAIDTIHNEVVDLGFEGGSTALICYIDKKTNRLYTASVGDSKAVIYRKNKKTENIGSIELTRDLDWSKPSEAKRAAKALSNDPEEQARIQREWTNFAGKIVRFPCLEYGLNVSRAIGDQDYQAYVKNPSKQAIIHKAEVTIVQLKPEDLVVMGCDGLWDFANIPDQIKHVIQPNWEDKEENLAAKLNNFALHSRYSSDNISVLTIRIV